MARRMAELEFVRVPTFAVSSTNQAQYVRGLVSDQEAEFILRIDGGLTTLRRAYADWLTPVEQVILAPEFWELSKREPDLKVAGALQFGTVILKNQPVLLVNPESLTLRHLDGLGTAALVSGNAVWLPASKEIYFRNRPLDASEQRIMNERLSGMGYHRVDLSVRGDVGLSVKATVNGEPLNLTFYSHFDFPVLDSSVAKRMKLKRHDSTLRLRKIGEQRRRYVDISDSLDLTIGDVTVKRRFAIAKDMFLKVKPADRKGEELLPSGVIGMDLLNDLAVVMDWGNKALWMKPPVDDAGKTGKK